MKLNKIISLFTASLIAVFASVAAYADDYTARGYVTFDGNELIEGYSSEIESATGEIQPGDTLVITVNVKNESDKAVNYYANNTIVKTFEDISGVNGAYEYELAFDGNAVYSSDTVGGDNTQGLKEINTLGDSGSEEFFFLGKLNAGESKDMTITLSLDGQTLDNDYQLTDAQLNLQFAVEETRPDSKENTIYVSKEVSTGNENLLWMYETTAVIAVTGIITVMLLAKHEKRKQVG